jgi:hypothetical protein
MFDLLLNSTGLAHKAHVGSRAPRLRIAKRGAQEHEQIRGRFAMSVTAPSRTCGQILA